jgi:endonuclease/exonuclease/phosphatase family metal-dependent hydrolase
MIAITVATINLRNRHDRWAQRRHLMVAELLDTQPDLISLQEISLPIGQGRWLRNQINSRLSGKSDRPYRLIQKRKQHLPGGYLEGIGILTKFPVLSHDAIGLGYGGRVALRATVELPSREPMDFVVTHLHHVAEDKEARVEQVMAMTGWMNERNPSPLQVIAGDFNEVPDGPAILAMKQIYRSAFVEVQGYDPLATFPTALRSPDVIWAGCLDYIFVSRAVDRVADARIFCRKPADSDPTLYPSDHVGLLVTLEIAGGPHLRKQD